MKMVPTFNHLFYQVNDYWEECRGLYAPFESGQKSGSADVYNHEMPGKIDRSIGQDAPYFFC